MDKAKEELRVLRAEGQSEAPEWADDVANRMLHTLTLKMEWVNEEPALVWQSWDRKVAGRLVEIHDRLVKEGRRPHRVTRLFTAPGQPLRRDMERFAAGERMSPALGRELLAYSLAKIDDTWGETAHRDVSLFFDALTSE